MKTNIGPAGGKKKKSAIYVVAAGSWYWFSWKVLILSTYIFLESTDYC